jgi:hypothetical protein
MAEQEEDMKRKRILLTVIHGQMIVNFVFSKSLVYLFIPILKETIFLNPTMCHMLECI